MAVLKEGDRVMVLGVYQFQLLESTLSPIGTVVHAYTNIYNQRTVNVEFRTPYSIYNIPFPGSNVVQLPYPKE